MQRLLQSLKAYIIFSIILGLVYPLLVTLIAQVFMPYKANGSLIIKNNKVVGSELIGQNFMKSGYFQSRPSVCSYDASNSGATNLGPSSKKLMDDVMGKIIKIKQENGLSPDVQIPGDMALSSASGLDPHISKENAFIQIKRIAKIRKMPEDALKKLVNENIDPDFIGIWGRPGVNVLKLNLALDELSKQ